jgi:hypothetical protein
MSLILTFVGLEVNTDQAVSLDHYVSLEHFWRIISN